MKVENPKERNELVFADKVSSVADSMRVLNAMLLNTHKQGYMYAVDKDWFFVPDIDQNLLKVGLLSDSLLYQNRLLSFIDALDRKHFIDLVRYLNRNYLSTCFVEEGLPVYMYRDDVYMADNQADLDRFVCLLDPEQRMDLRWHKILDKHDSLYLLANKDARIWSDN